MTEKEWNECYDIYKMRGFVKSDRKLRLFSCACARQLWNSLNNSCKETVILSEQFADNLIDTNTLKKAYDAVRNSRGKYNERSHPEEASIQMILWITVPHSTAICTTECFLSYIQAKIIEAKYNKKIHSRNDSIAVELQAKSNAINFLKDICDPFGKYKQPKTNETIIHLANEIYNNPNDNGFFNNNYLSVLADMLYDENCDENLVNHLRIGNHVRGCEVIDLILEKK